MSMKYQSSIAIKLLLVLTICILSSCEKHEGVQYFKSKCVAELNGHTLIDQTPFNIGPNSTPSIIADDYSIEFKSILRNERGVLHFMGSPLYCLLKPHGNILHSRKLSNILKQENLTKILHLGNIHAIVANQISYATILSYSDYENELVKDGTFEITSYNKENKVYNGIFTLNFSEGTLNGDFSEVI